MFEAEIDDGRTHARTDDGLSPITIVQLLIAQKPQNLTDQTLYYSSHNVQPSYVITSSPNKPSHLPSISPTYPILLYPTLPYPTIPYLPLRFNTTPYQPTLHLNQSMTLHLILYPQSHILYLQSKVAQFLPNLPQYHITLSQPYPLISHLTLLNNTLPYPNLALSTLSCLAVCRPTHYLVARRFAPKMFLP